LIYPIDLDPEEAVNLAYQKLGVVSVGVESKDFVEAIMQTLRGRPDA